MAITAPQAVVPIRTLQNMARLNPNFGGEVLVVGLGCEKLAPERLLVPERRGAWRIVRMQDEAFDGSAHRRTHHAMAEARLAISTPRRETCPASDLVVGLQCGGSDAFPA